MTDSLIIRSNLRENFTVIPNDLANDSRLKADELGLIVYLLTKPNDWRVRITELRKRFSIGKDKAYKVIANLEACGYITRESIRSEGRFNETRYIVRDLPCTPKPFTEKPLAVDQPITKNKDHKEPKITKSTNKKPIADLVLTDKLKEYAEGLGLDANEVIEDIRIWDMQNGHKARYVSLDGFFMGWVRREAKRAKPSYKSDSKPANKPARALSDKQKEFAHAALAKRWDKEKLSDQGYSFQSLLDDYHAFMLTNQTDQDWLNLGTGLAKPF